MTSYISHSPFSIAQSVFHQIKSCGYFGNEAYYDHRSHAAACRKDSHFSIASVSEFKLCNLSVMELADDGNDRPLAAGITVVAVTMLPFVLYRDLV